MFPLSGQRDALSSTVEAWVSSPWRRVFSRCHGDAMALLKTAKSVVIGVGVDLGSLTRIKK